MHQVRDPLAPLKLKATDERLSEGPEKANTETLRRVEYDLFELIGKAWDRSGGEEPGSLGLKGAQSSCSSGYFISLSEYADDTCFEQRIYYLPFNFFFKFFFNFFLQ